MTNHEPKIMDVVEKLMKAVKAEKIQVCSSFEKFVTDNELTLLKPTIFLIPSVIIDISLEDFKKTFTTVLETGGPGAIDKGETFYCIGAIFDWKKETVVCILNYWDSRPR